MLVLDPVIIRYMVHKSLIFSSFSTLHMSV
jgi:hypothetical protein